MVIRGRLAALALAGSLALPAFAEAPGRVVSINLCTDQLAMMLAAPGQLVSVTYLAQDPRASVMAAEARAYPVNHGLAEEVYLLRPDLVLAGRFTAQATVAMLQRLGIAVVIFDPAYSLQDVRQGMLDMGRTLARDAEGQAMAESFSARLAEIAAPASAVTAPRPTAATYAANGYTSGDRSLSGEIIEAAGFEHLAASMGLPQGGVLPLEALILADPDLVISGQPYPGASRAEEVLSHPALLALSGDRTAMQDRDWICGLPSVLAAIERLRATREEIGGQE
jgi:iron complex transport system substrate-binding protein